jgi:thiopeptide-type bacteriocin biosynthesis protein
VFIEFDDWDTAERTAVACLRPVLVEAEGAGLIRSWFFIRKAPCWRVRFLPVDITPADAGNFVRRRLDGLPEAGHLARWVETIYEPETHAFGGSLAMDAAHELFHQDSRNILAFLDRAQPATGVTPRSHRREVSVLLCSALLRGAALDWYEQGDVWARVAENRPLPPDAPPDRMRTMESDVRRLMTVDIGHLVTDDGPLANLSNWAGAFDRAGKQLGDLARNGILSRGLRAVLAHHVIFAWNRIGLSNRTQSILAHTAATVVFGQ